MYALGAPGSERTVVVLRVRDEAVRIYPSAEWRWAVEVILVGGGPSVELWGEYSREEWRRVAP